jgi:hypothetical protein
MQKLERTYTLYEAHKLGLILQPSGKPYKSKIKIRQLLDEYGILKTAVDFRGNNCFALTKEDVNKINYGEKTKYHGKQNP